MVLRRRWGIPIVLINGYMAGVDAPFVSVAVVTALRPTRGGVAVDDRDEAGIGGQRRQQLLDVLREDADVTNW